MKSYKNRLLLVTVVLIFLLFTSYNIGSAYVHYKYNQASNINAELEEVMSMIQDNPEALEKLNNINEELYFINAFCFDEEELE